MEVYYHFSVSSKCAGALNEIFDFIEMEGSNVFGHVPTEWLSLLPCHRKYVKMLVCCYFQSLGQEEYPALAQEQTEGKNGERIM